MKLPKKIKAKWLKALRSGKYKQTQDVVYDADSKGFCCLGVLQHVTMDGRCEVGEEGSWDEGAFVVEPTMGYWRSIGCTVRPNKYNPTFTKSKIVSRLIDMNDGNDGVKPRNFNQIADYIEKNVGTTD